MDASYLELVESERFGPTRLLSVQVDKLEKERFTVYKRNTKLSGTSVEFLYRQTRKENEDGKN
jgi:hypothetical protein